MAIDNQFPDSLPEAACRRLLEAIDHGDIGLALTDAEDRFIYVNEAHARIYGRSREEILGRTWRDLTPPEAIQASEEAFSRCAARGEVFRVEVPGFRGDGTAGHHQVAAVPLSGDGGGYAGHVCIVQDITEHKRAEEAVRESEKKYRLLLENLQEGVWSIDAEARTTFVNPAMAEILGYTVDEMLGKHLFSFMDERGVEICSRLLEHRRQGIKERHDFEFLRKDGTRVYTMLETSPITDDDGNYLGAIAGVVDITEQKQAEEALRAERDRAQGYLDVAGVILVVIDLDGRVSLINKRGCEVLGFEEQEIIGRNWFETFLPERVRPEVEAVHQKGISGELEAVEYYENPVLTRSGEERIIAWHNALLRDKTGKVIGGLSSGEDITERRRAEEELRKHRGHLEELVEERTAELKAANEQLQQEVAERKQAEEKLALYKEIIAKSSEAIAIIDPQGHYLEQNAAHRSVLGYSDEELRGKTPAIHLEEETFSAIARQLAKEGAYRGELTSRTKSGASVEIDLSAFAVRDDAGQPLCYVGIKRDITERKRAAEALAESERRYRALVDNALVGIYQTKLGGEILYVNPALARMMGCESPEEMVGCNVNDFYAHPERRRAFLAEVMAHGRVSGFEMETRTKQGEPRTMLASASLSGGVIEGMLMDISERKRAEEALRRSEQELRLIAENVPALFSYVDSDGCYRFVNKRYEEWFGRPETEVIGKHYREVLGEAAYELIKDRVESALSGQHVSYEDALPYAAGGRRWVLANYVPDIDERGEVKGFFALVTDISERKRAEEALRIRDSAIASSISAIAIADPEGRLTYVNDAFLKLWGYDDAQEVLGKSNLEFWQQPEEASEVIEALREKGSWVGELVARRKDGSPFDVQLLASMVADEAGQPICLMASLVDITERKRAEEALRASEERLKLAQSAAGIGTWEWDIQSNTVKCSEEYLGLYGLVPGNHKLSYQGWLRRLHPEDRERMVEKVSRALQGKEPYEAEFRVVWPDGSVHWLFAKATVLVDEAGRPAGMIGANMDITERKRAEEEIERARRRIEELARREEQRANWLATILEQMPVGVVIARAPDARIVLANQAAEEIWGMPTAYVEAGKFARHWRHLWPDGSPVRDEEIALSRAILGGEPVSGDEYILERPDGSRINMMANAAPLLEEGQVVGGVVTFWDVTAEREAQRKLEEASRLKDEFLSMASHELKTPITSIKVFSELAARRPDKLEPRLAETLLRQADQLTALINDLLDVSRLELGRMPMEMRRLDLAGLVSEVCERRRPLCKHHLLICPTPEDEILVQGDPVRLEQVFSNLFDNAHKYAPEGGRIEIRLGRKDGKALVEVQDEGIGISAEHLPYVFERFYKPGPQQSVYSGLGVGLYISREIVERHGGRIWAESEEGRGSTFCVELPLAEIS